MIELTFTPEELQIIIDALFDRKIDLKQKNNPEYNEEIATIENDLLPKLNSDLFGD